MKQIEILKKGVNHWNKWRANNPDVEIDLREANLKWVNLLEANFQGADLRGADLRWADLRRASLQEASLRWAYLRGAKLRGASLRGTDLRKADLRWANLQEASLQEANLQEANLRGANLQGASLPFAIPSKASQDALLKKIAKLVIANPDKLKMSRYHSPCGTAHCIAGWAVSLSENGKAIEEKSSSYLAGRILLGEEVASHFFSDDGKALEYLKSIV